MTIYSSTYVSRHVAVRARRARGGVSSEPRPTKTCTQFDRTTVVTSVLAERIAKPRGDCTVSYVRTTPWHNRTRKAQTTSISQLTSNVNYSSNTNTDGSHLQESTWLGARLVFLADMPGLAVPSLPFLAAHA